MNLPLKNLRHSLNKRIKELKSRFRFIQSKSGITTAQEDKLRGLIVLCHAELEDYFESVAKLILNEGKSVWDTKSVANYNFASLLIRGKRAEKSNLDPGTLLHIILQSYESVITGNNGIKSSNIHDLFWPLGYNDEDFDSLLLSQLDSFGTQRGTIVHSSAKKAIQQLDKNSVYKVIDDIIIALKSFENTLLSKMT